MPDQVPGFLAVARSTARAEGPDLVGALDRLGLTGVGLVRLPVVDLAVWGLAADPPTVENPLLLSRTNRGHSGEVTGSQVGQWLVAGAWDALDTMLPPFGALGITRGGYSLVADRMGFRQVFSLEGPGWTAMSTSARTLGALNGLQLDADAVRIQSLLGWQLAQRTLFSGVTKLRPGESLQVEAGRVDRDSRAWPTLERIPLETAVVDAASLLKSLLEAYLDECPDPTLQLTGGQDSRIILSAIPPARRKGLRVMTLAVPGSPDAAVAATLAARYGMRHQVQSLEGLERLSPQEAFARVCAAARRVDCMSDPLARAATLWAEEHVDQGDRLSGLGGEIARGFYYMGRVRALPVTRARAEHLAKWRMFANEAVEGGALDPDFLASAFPSAIDAVYEALAVSGRDWYSATDQLYYRHRMQRWAGLGESAVCFDRSIVNPMLDDRFLAIAEALAPRDKQNSQFLARLQVNLDEDLARVPLDNRPPPRAFAYPGPGSLLRQQAAKTVLTSRKVLQRVRGAHRPPAGAGIIASKAREHLRSSASMLDPLRGMGVFRESWLDGVSTGTIRAEPSSLALLVNLLVASGTPGPDQN